MSTTIRRNIAGNTDRTALALRIEALVAGLHPTVSIERRRDLRIALPALFRLIPLDATHETIDYEAITVVGRNISRHGLSFYHEQPLPYRRAVICLEHPRLESFAAEIDITWCRFTKPGWYESGGRLIRLVKQPLHTNDGAILKAVTADITMDLGLNREIDSPCAL
jgi:hypothetical protein